MPYVLLATGALMTIAGFYAVVTGYGVVQLEQGWSAVIAGSTLIAGGVVTMAMAALLRALQQVKAALSGAPLVLSTPAFASTPSSASTPDSSSTPDLEPATSVQEADSRPLPVTLPPASTAALATVADAPKPETVTDFYESPSLTSALDPVPAPAPPPASAAAPFDFAAAPPAPRPSDDFKLKPPSPADHAPPMAKPEEVPPVAAEPESPAMDDWLDRAFADLDEVRQTPPHREPTPAARSEDIVRDEPAPFDAPIVKETTPSERAPKEVAYAGLPASAPLTVADVAPEPAPVPPTAPTSAVIGRYEADGTSYTMYADGSIEAQSDAGVYRFASMAELKSFIET